MKIKKIITNYKRHSRLNKMNFGVKSNQFYLASFPKSGNTWIRFIIANLLSGNRDVNLKNLMKYIPDSHVEEQVKYVINEKNIFNQFNFQFIKTHDLKNRYYYNKNIIYVVRDGRDVINSYFHYINARNNEKLNIEDIILNNHDSPFGSWSDHILSWCSDVRENFFLLKYENLLKEPFNEMSNLLSAINWKIENNKLKQAIEKSSFDKLQKIEKKKGIMFDQKLLQKDSLFFRSGRLGDWKNYFSSKNNDLFWEKHGLAMNKLGYKR